MTGMSDFGKLAWYDRARPDQDYLDRKAELEQLGGAFADINPNDKKFASKMRAAMARDAWDDYQTRFEPYERQLIDQVTDPLAELDQRLSAISFNNRQSFDAAQQGTEMMRDRYGVSTSDRQRGADHRGMRHAAVLSEVDARNNTRTHIVDRNMAVIAGGGSRQAIEDT